MPAQSLKKLKNSLKMFSPKRSFSNPSHTHNHTHWLTHTRCNNGVSAAKKENRRREFWRMRMCGRWRIWESEKTKSKRRPVNVCEHAEKQMQTVFAAGKFGKTKFRRKADGAADVGSAAEAPPEVEPMFSADRQLR